MDALEAGRRERGLPGIHGRGRLERRAEVIGRETQQAAAAERVRGASRQSMEFVSRGRAAAGSSLRGRVQIKRQGERLEVKNEEEVSRKLRELKRSILEKIQRDAGAEEELDPKDFIIDFELTSAVIRMIRRSDRKEYRLDLVTMAYGREDRMHKEIVSRAQQILDLRSVSGTYIGSNLFQAGRDFENNERYDNYLGIPVGLDGFTIQKRNFSTKEKGALEEVEIDHLIYDLNLLCGENEGLKQKVSDLYHLYLDQIERQIEAVQKRIDETPSEIEGSEKYVEGLRALKEKLKKIQQSKELLLIAALRSMESDIPQGEDKEEFLLNKINEFFKDHKQFRARNKRAARKYRGLAVLVTAAALYSYKVQEEREGEDPFIDIGRYPQYKALYRAFLDKHGINSNTHLGLIGEMIREESVVGEQARVVMQRDRTTRAKLGELAGSFEDDDESLGFGDYVGTAAAAAAEMAKERTIQRDRTERAKLRESAGSFEDDDESLGFGDYVETAAAAATVAEMGREEQIGGHVEIGEQWFTWFKAYDLGSKSFESDQEANKAFQKWLVEYGGREALIAILKFNATLDPKDKLRATAENQGKPFLTRAQMDVLEARESLSEEDETKIQISRRVKELLEEIFTRYIPKRMAQRVASDRVTAKEDEDQKLLREYLLGTAGPIGKYEGFDVDAESTKEAPAAAAAAETISFGLSDDVAADDDAGFGLPDAALDRITDQGRTTFMPANPAAARRARERSQLEGLFAAYKEHRRGILAAARE